MSKRWKGDDELEYNDDSYLYLPDEELKKALHNRDAFIVYKDGKIVVDDIADDNNNFVKVETSRDYAIAKLFVELQDYCKAQALPLLDFNCCSGDLEQFLKAFF